MSKKIVLVTILIVVVLFGYYLYLVNIPYSKVSEVAEFNVHSGWGSVDIAKQLDRQGFIKSKNAFILYVWKNGISSRLQSGEYELAKNLNIKEVAQVLSGGLVKGKEETITIIEGWSNNDVGKYFEDQGLYKLQELLAIVGSPTKIYENDAEDRPYDFSEHYEFLKDKPKNIGLEGYLFPDTYRVYKDSELISVVRKMLDNFDSKLTPEMREQIRQNNMDIHSTLTLASIIEKEVSTESDRRKVASVFYKRMNDDIPLQADSTVNYITGKDTEQATIADTQIDNSYNTYKYLGLPPGPICNPSLESIKAAIYPDKNSYYYFLTTPDDEVIYSRTYEEHKANKAKYLD